MFESKSGLLGALRDSSAGWPPVLVLLLLLLKLMLVFSVLVIELSVEEIVEAVLAMGFGVTAQRPKSKYSFFHKNQNLHICKI